VTDTEPVLHVEELTERGYPTGHALCDDADGTTPGGRLAVNNGDATCERCIARLNGDEERPAR
jgi:hypothetical protein